METTLFPVLGFGVALLLLTVALFAGLAWTRLVLSVWFRLDKLLDRWLD
jgi:hypothetical protein